MQILRWDIHERRDLQGEVLRQHELRPHLQYVRLQLRSPQVLEYRHRAPHRARARDARRGGLRPGAIVLRLRGGRQSIGNNNIWEWVSLNPNDPAFVSRSGDALLDSWIFAARAPIDCVWRNGVKLVENGHHVHGEAIAARYRRALARILV